MSDIDELNAFVAAPQAGQDVASAQPQSSDIDLLNQFVAPELNQQQHGTLPQQALAGLEGAARGASLGVSDYLEPKLFGTTKEDIKGRMEANPVTSFAGTALGGAGLIAGTGGLGALGEAAAGGAGLGATLLSTGAEGALFGAGTAVSDSALGDPNLNAQKVLADVGMGAALGIGAGTLGSGLKSLVGKFGGAKGSIPEVLAGEANSANQSAETARAVKSLDSSGFKQETPEILAASERLGLPTEIGQVTSDPFKQKATNALLSGAPTYSAIKTTAKYENIWNTALKAIDDVVPEQGLSKAETGSVVQDGLTNKIAQENAPISQLFDEIKKTSQEIPLSDRSAPSIARNILDMQEVKLSPSSPEAKLASRVADEIPNLKTVDDVKAYRAILNRSVSPTASSGEKRILAILGDKLQNLEENTITRHAEGFLDDFSKMDPETQSNFQAQADRYGSLLEQKKQAAELYKPFITKVSDLAEQLGKKRVYGPQDAINFIKDLDPEQIANRLGKKDSSGFRSFFEDAFPEENSVLRDYQRGAMRDAATKDGVFNPKSFFNKFDDLEPEMQNNLFAPDEIQKINDAKTVIRSVPKDFNPSGTSGMSAFREFFHSPSGALMSNARDFGIESYLNMTSKLPESIRPNPYEVGAEMAQKFNQLSAAQKLIDRTDKAIQQNAQAIFAGGVAAATAIGASELTHIPFDKKVKRIEELANNPDTMNAQMSNHIDGISQQMPGISQGLSTSMAMSVGFLNSKVPRAKNNLPMNAKWLPSLAQKQKFNTYFNTVANPISVMKNIKNGSLTSEHMEALRATHPELLQHMQKQLIQNFSPDKAMKLPSSTRRSLSMFMGQPLDDGNLPQVVIANQATFQMPNQSQNQAKTPRSTVGGLKQLKVAGRTQTETHRDQRSDEV